MRWLRRMFIDDVPFGEEVRLRHFMPFFVTATVLVVAMIVFAAVLDR